jgi:lysophospholipase L1-like esterase
VPAANTGSEPASDGGAESVPVEAAPAPTSEAPAAPPLPEKTTVLHVGDSFAGALGIALNDELKQSGVRGVLKYKTASYLPTWAWEPDLELHLANYHPDLVIVTLGANELEVEDPTIRIKPIRRIVERIGDRPCVWVGIPLWEGARGLLLDVIKANVAPCVYLDSSALYPDMPRARDKIHPNTAARVEWAKRVALWLAKHRKPKGEKVWAIEP